jgi:hypothetical protein
VTVVKTVKRPSSITLISIFGILSGFLSFYYVFQNDIRGPSLGNTVFFVLSGIVFLACGIGFWLMKKWAVYTYMVFAVIDQIFLLVFGRWNILALLISAIVIYVGYKHLSEMS